MLFLVLTFYVLAFYPSQRLFHFSVQLTCHICLATDTWQSRCIRSALRKVNVVEDTSISRVLVDLFSNIYMDYKYLLVKHISSIGAHLLHHMRLIPLLLYFYSISSFFQT